MKSRNFQNCLSKEKRMFEKTIEYFRKVHDLSESGVKRVPIKMINKLGAGASGIGIGGEECMDVLESASVGTKSILSDDIESTISIDSKFLVA